MKPIATTFSAFYTQWVSSFLAKLPGGAPAAPEEPTPKEALVAAHQEWEDEGGSIKPPDTKPGLAPAPKIPF